MAASIGWLVLQRNLTGSVRVAGTPEVWVTTVFTTPSRHIVGMHADASPGDSLRQAVTAAVREPARGAPRQRPAFILAPTDLVAAVRDTLRGAGWEVAVDEVVPPDWAEDLLDELTAHLAGRPQHAPPPSPEQWALLHQQTAAYAQAAPWERRADDVHLRLEMTIGARRSDWIAIVTGNAGIARGFVLSRGRSVPPELLADDPEVLPPEGTCHVVLTSSREAPPELPRRARRYGWPDDLDEVPLFVMVGPEGRQEIGGRETEAITVALAATVDHDRQGAGFGIEVAGEITLAAGRRARYRAVLESNEPLPMPPGVHLFSGEVRFDWLPHNALIGLGGLPWPALTEVRGRAQWHLPPPQARSARGGRLPVLILGMAATQGRRVARLLHDAHPEGVALMDDGDGVLTVVISRAGIYGVTRFDADAAEAVARYRQGLAVTDGWHGILVSTPRGQGDDPVFGFFECVLSSPPSQGRTSGSRGRQRTGS